MTPLVENGIPVPRKPQGRAPLYPFAGMQVNDSFFLACDGSPRPLVTRILVAARHYVAKHAPSARFTTRRVEGGVRCWRVA